MIIVGVSINVAITDIPLIGVNSHFSFINVTDWSVIIAVLFGLYMCHCHEKTFKLYTHGEDLWSSPILLFPTESCGVYLCY